MLGVTKTMKIWIPEKIKIRLNYNFLILSIKNIAELYKKKLKQTEVNEKKN